MSPYAFLARYCEKRIKLRAPKAPNAAPDKPSWAPGVSINLLRNTYPTAPNNTYVAAIEHALRSVFPAHVDARVLDIQTRSYGRMDISISLGYPQYDYQYSINDRDYSQYRF